MNIDIILEENGQEQKRMSVALGSTAHIGPAVSHLIDQYRRDKPEEPLFDRVTIRFLREGQDREQ